jgi:cytidylate kinase
MAVALNYVFIDSGAMYRAVTLFLMRQSVNLDDMAQVEQALAQLTVEFDVDDAGASFVTLNGENVENEIRTIAVASKVSEVAKIQAVRDKLVYLQQQMGVKKGVVMDGRDIGTVVFPDAELKIFMTASLETRALRRTRQFEEQGKEEDFNRVRSDIENRDHRDITRAESPLAVAKDAKLLETGGLTIEHGLCNEDGTPRTYYSQSEITSECKRRGLTRWTDCHEANRTKDAEIRMDWMKSGEAQRQKADRDERRAAGERINTWTRTAPKQNSPETRAQITHMVRQRLARYA